MGGENPGSERDMDMDTGTGRGNGLGFPGQSVQRLVGEWSPLFHRWALMHCGFVQDAPAAPRSCKPTVCF